MAAKPWDSISLSRIRQPPAERKDFAEARANPCLSCPTSPCCWYLPLHTVEPVSYLDLDGLYKLALFERIELGFSPEGTWSVYYRYPCRFLGRDEPLCQVHDTELQPKTCVYYKPYGCWYKRVLTGPASPEYLRVDLRRFREIVGGYRFDENRRIIATPPWDKVREICAGVLQDEVAAGLPEEPSDDVLLSDPALERAPRAEAQGVEFLDVLADRCEGCQAPCCSYLCFRIAPPPTFMSLDFYRFALGFPGVELGVSGDSWWLVVHTDCRALDRRTRRCQLHGQAERPLSCSYYNPWSCTYRDEFTRPLPPGFARLRYEHFPLLAALIEFDARGQIVRHPTVEELHEALRSYWGELLLESGAAEGPREGDGRPVVDVLRPTPGSEAFGLATRIWDGTGTPALAAEQEQ